MKLARSIVLLAALAALAGCEGIGDGSTVVSIEIRDPGFQPITGPFPVSRCLRDQVVAIATFTDGTIADFSYRVQWTSSDPATVAVSNGEILQPFVDDGAFATKAGFTYRPGTVVPAGAAGATATITATFLNMSSSKDVLITTPTLRIAPLADIDPMQAPPTAYLGPATLQRFGFYVEQEDGRVLLPNGLNLIGSLNPVLWSFEGGQFDAADTATDPSDFDKFAVPSAASPSATITPTGGVVRGVTPDGATYTVRATTSVCENDPAFTPTASIRVAPFATTNPLTLEHEADINGAGVPFTGDLVAGTGERLKVLGHLDTDGDGAGNFTQDLGDQVDVNLTHTQGCTSSADSNCVCDSAGANCVKQMLGINGNLVFSLITDDGETATAQACFTNVDALHADDCEETPADSSQFQLLSGTLGLQVVPVDLSGANATVSVDPASAAQVAFTYPGQQFDAYGTFTALDGFSFAGGPTGTQKITRNGTWTARKQGSTTEFPSAGFVRNNDDGFFGGIGSFAYAKDVAADTIVDVNFTPGTPFQSIAAPASPVPFKICPSTAGSCAP